MRFEKEASADAKADAGAGRRPGVADRLQTGTTPNADAALGPPPFSPGRQTPAIAIGQGYFC
jgi:hypothetical protein